MSNQNLALKLISPKPPNKAPVLVQDYLVRTK